MNRAIGLEVATGPADVASLKGPPPRPLLVRLDIATKNPLNNSQGRTRAGMLWRARKRKELRSRTSLQCLLQLGEGDPWIVVQCVEVDRAKGTAVFMPYRVARYTITLTRISPRRFDDEEGWNAAAKPIRDGAADFLGVKDNDARCTWNYNQKKGRVREHAVEITFERDPQ
jgi:hypothetical protein